MKEYTQFSLSLCLELCVFAALPRLSSFSLFFLSPSIWLQGNVEHGGTIICAHVHSKSTYEAVQHNGLVGCTSHSPTPDINTGTLCLQVAL